MYLTYFNGAWNEGNTPLFGAMDHSVWLGSSVFDGARSVRGHMPDLRPHLQRVIHSADRLGMQCPHSVDEMEALVREGVAKFPADAELYIRPLVFATDGLLVPVPEKSAFALTLFDAPIPPFTGFTACLSALLRPDGRMAPTDAKASSLYANTTRVLREAKAKGFDNAVVCDMDGNVAEFATANLFFVTPDGAVVTPALNGTFLAGITRARVIALLKDDGVLVEERSVRPEELASATEIFNTGNFGKVTPCVRYEERALPVGPVATRARDLYFAFLEAN
ncbi:branched-chain amino acid aminotransferase [Pseudoduganella chitinolytica]|uniref:branched-chain-amino-acid transaminase n=1 Tax=Pseudoduganella chitinolytica TaxID=34070 RepID=A0ABY8BJB7_9BURK|nr:branched-chain amino acid aminotransferase [Pseudoduganella chitinolytica]WEF35438.1 branched-chain amino acid aminotransferase [Pseudoduganella chitinolytica]